MDFSARSRYSRWCLAVILGLALGHARAADTDAAIVISSGPGGGGYWSVATRMQEVGAELGLSMEVLESRGSLHNLQQLHDPASPVNVTLTQADALQFYLDEYPELAAQLDILEHIGQECVYLIAASGSGINGVADLQGPKSRRLAIASSRSGVAVTFDYMKTLVPALSNTRVVYTDTNAALAQLQDADSTVDAVMVVHRPKEHSPELDRARQQPDRYQLVNIVDERFGKKLPNGDRVYNSLNLALPGGGAVRTICMKGLLISNRQKMNRDLRYSLGDVLNYHWMRIYVPG